MSIATSPTSSASDERRGTLVAASFGTALALVAFTMPLGLMTAISPDLGASVAGRTWILSSMSVGLAAALLVAGSLADDLGRRRLFLVGLVAFSASSFLAAAAPSVFVVSVARGAQGIGGAAMLASALSLIAHAYPTATGPERAHATGVWGAMLGLGIAIGPIFGVLVAEIGDWRTAYAALGSIAAIAVVPAAAALVESRAAVRRPLDPVGAALLALGLLAITAGIVQGNAAGWGSLLVVVCLLASVALFAAFARHELATPEPLFDVRLLRTRAFTAALAGSFSLGLAVLAFMSYAMTFTQTTLGATPVAASFWSLPWAAVTFAVAMRGRWLAHRMTTRTQVTTGLALCGIGLLTMLGLHAGDSPARLVPGYVIMGVGTGFLNAALAQAAVSVVPPERSGMGAGANNTARYLGAALGVALVVGTLHAGTQSRAEHALGQVLEPSLAVPLAHEIASGAPRTAAAGFLPDADALVDQIAATAGTEAMNVVIRNTALITFIGAAFCFALMRPPRRTDGRDDDDPAAHHPAPPLAATAESWPSTKPAPLWAHSD